MEKRSFHRMDLQSDPMELVFVRYFRQAVRLDCLVS